jgi:myo-inositol-1(or 4)-monophosphatase
MKETLLEALHLSGEILMQYFNTPLTHNVKESQSSIVTEADFASDKAIRELIGKRFPEHNLVSEETGFTNKGSAYTWVVDPLDGTSNFAAGIPWFGVLITILKNNEPVMAGAYLPCWQTTYYAEKGKGAFRNDEKPPQLKDISLKNSLFAFCVDYTDDIAFLEKGMDIYRYLVRSSRNIRTTNCLIDFIHVAEGKFGGVLNLYTRIWDICGLGLIITEAGGVMQYADGTALFYDLKENVSEINYPVLAANNQVAKEMNTDILLRSFKNHYPI